MTTASHTNALPPLRFRELPQWPIILNKTADANHQLEAFADNEMWCTDCKMYKARNPPVIHVIRTLYRRESNSYLGIVKIFSNPKQLTLLLTNAYSSHLPTNWAVYMNQHGPRDETFGGWSCFWDNWVAILWIPQQLPPILLLSVSFPPC